MKFKNIFLYSLMCFLLFLNLNTTLVKSAALFSGVFTQAEEDLLNQSGNASKLAAKEAECNSYSGGRQVECFDELAISQILIISRVDLSRADLCNDLIYLNDDCFREIAHDSNDVGLCNSIDNSDVRNNCIAILIKIKALEDDDITLCDNIPDPTLKHNCIISVIAEQEDLNFCNSSFIVDNNLVDECESVILSQQALDNNDSTLCEQIPLLSYREICFFELGFYCGDTICTNVFENHSTCPQDCITTDLCEDGVIGNSDPDGNGVYTLEECDDGLAPQDGDGCSALCKVESGYECTGEPSDCIPICGDGKIISPETCDDENSINPGCSAICEVESGYECTGEPSVCNLLCGNGDPNDPGEQCDDGNLIDRDSCSSTCQNELYNVAWCSDNILFVGVEECDDGNLIPGDGCDETCKTEIPPCGNGVVDLDLGEECDYNSPVYGSHCNTSCECDDNSEYCALSALFMNADGQNWNDNTNWLSDSLLGDWFGVNTTDGEVITVSLGANKLEGQVPSEFNNLFNLIDLNLSNNKLSGPIPSMTSNLSTLNLSDNNISDISALNVLVNLSTLNLKNNNFSNASAVNNLDKLSFLSLAGNDIQDLSIDVCNNLDYLVSLHLEGNQLEDGSCEVINCLYERGIFDFRYNSQQNNFNFFDDCIGICGDGYIWGSEECEPPGLTMGSTDIVQQAKLIADDGVSNDYFGNSVAIDGDYIVVGAYIDDNNNGIDAGSVYIFKYVGNIWTEQAKLIANDGFADDYFGNSVAIDGDYIVVGARGNGNSGSAYIFKRNGTAWNQEDKISVGGINDYFGNSVAIDGDYIVVGAVNNSNSGSAYIFKRNGTIWSQEDKIVSSDISQEDAFGNSVSINGDRVIIGAYKNDDNGSNSGSAYIFKRNGTIWSQEDKILASDGFERDFFGNSVSINGDRVIIGAYKNDDNGSNSGSAYIFKRNGTIWSQEDKILASDGVAYSSFGNSVSINGDKAIISAHTDSNSGIDSGSVYIFKYVGNIWTEQTKLIADDGLAYDYFGASVAMNEDNIIIGASENNGNSVRSGSTYIFGQGCIMASMNIGVMTCDSNDCIWECQ